MPFNSSVTQSITAALTPTGNTRIFVYGTLRDGQRNHQQLSEARFIGTGETVSHFTLRVDNLLPYLDASNPLYPVRGEVYEVDSSGLRAIDHLEGHPRWYRRRVISIRLDKRPGAAVKDVVEAFAYFHSDALGQIHPTGDYTVPITTSLPKEVAV
jgi:gamma-glutamylcyclotransferase (GGCT)/AIG2-like uncharacterized protein YtfP